MANNPKTYDCRVALKNGFSAISECRRVAMKRLPVNFFIVMFDDMVKAILDKDDPYSDIVKQALDYRWANNKIEQQYIDATMDIFDNTLKKFNINDPVVSKVYREFITNTKWVLSYINSVVSVLKHH